MTKQAAAIAEANAILAAMAQFATLRATLQDLINRYNSEAYNTIWASLATAALNADGSLGLADGAPVGTNPIDTRVFSSLTKTVKASDLTAGITFMEDFILFLTNQPVSTSQRSQTLDNLAN